MYIHNCMCRCGNTECVHLFACVCWRQWWDICAFRVSTRMRLWSQWLWQITCSAPFPHCWYSLSSFLFNTHRELPIFFPIFLFCYAVVAYSCCTVLITYKEKPAYISKGEDESGLIICNVWVPFIGTKQKEKEEMVATVNSKKSSHPLNWWLYGREFGGCCQSHCVF